MALQPSLKEKLQERSSVPQIRTAGAEVKEFIQSQKAEITKSLPRHVTLDRLERVALGAINKTPLLGQCTKASLIYAFITSTQLGLECNTPLGEAYLIPYKRSVKQGNEWVSIYECQFQIGLQGVLSLAQRTGKFRVIQAKHVYANDKLEINYGTGGVGRLTPAVGDRGDFIGVFAYYQLVDGGEDFLFWSKEQIEAHARRYSKSWNEKEKAWQKGSAWGENFEGMAPIPVLRALLKFAPKSIELVRQLAMDGSVRTSVDTITYGDDVPVQVEYSNMEEDPAPAQEAPQATGE